MVRRVGIVSCLLGCCVLTGEISRADSFRVPNSDCLTNTAACHSSPLMPRPGLIVSTQFDGLGTVNTAILSQHNVRYDSDNNLQTIEDARDPGTSGRINECKKCHGNGRFHSYVARGARLAYPDYVVDGDGKVGTAVPTSANFATYQDFCLSCHDGVRRTTNPAFPEAFQSFGGAIPVQQLPPTLAANPGAQQPMNGTRGPLNVSGWLVPPVPARDIAVGAAPNLTVVPYFQYYETNGHGRATGLASTPEPRSGGGIPMDVTCLENASGGAQGCHDFHGSRNRFLISDSGTFTNPIVTVSEVAGNLCKGCHSQFGTMAGTGTGRVDPAQGFHSWAPHVIPSVPLTTGGPAPGTTAPFATTLSMVVGKGAQRNNLLLPYYGTPTADISARRYSTGAAAGDPPVVGTDVIMCLTCHDPHGTSLLYGHTACYGEIRDALDPTTINCPVSTPDSTPNTQGMLRKFPVLWSGRGSLDLFHNDPLCGECHL